MTNRTATVETLTAEVRVLMVGSRQVTMSVYGQLDNVRADEIEPFGRVNPKDGNGRSLYVVGKNAEGVLVRASTLVTAHAILARAATIVRLRHGGHACLPEDEITAENERLTDRAEEWAALPLIVLAGLR